jgi:WhiB family redox-sensing transcriptional regulator
VDIVTTLYGRQERSWQIQANCMGVDPDLFFPERGASTREAKEVCRGCVVREDCLEYALANGEKFGIWGGMSERERRRVRRARALQRRDAVTPPRGVPPSLAGRADRASGRRLPPSPRRTGRVRPSVPAQWPWRTDSG